MRWLMWESSNRKMVGRRNSGRNTRRRRSPPRWLRPALFTFMIVCIFGSVVGGPIWLWRSGWIFETTEAIWLGVVEKSVAMGLLIQDVQLEGRRHSSKTQVIKSLGLKRGDPIITFDIYAARRRLMSLPWIREANVTRRLPDKIQISIQERQPMALWQRKGRLVLVDTLGVVVTNRKLGKFRNLVIILGKDAPHHAATLFAMLDSEPVLARKVTAAVRVGSRRWNVRLKPGIRIQLPENDPHLAWHRLARMNQQHKLLSRDVKTIDMRIPNKLIVEPGALGRHLKGIGRTRGHNT